ncbi:MAG TPA: MYXO-CTERM sorting domain-containing protein [Polyangiaceae bacterium]
MFLNDKKSWQRQWIALAAWLLMLLVSGVAFAGGRIEWGSKKIKPRSDNNSWNIDIKIFMPKAPDVPSVPTKFIFLQTVYYERAMVDGDKLTVRNVPIEGKLPIVESVDIGFLDPRSGKIENRTQFSFKLHRDHGFECGEYKVTVRDARNDSIIGQPVNIVLDGENEVIDRRSIVFSGEKKKKVDSTGGTGDEKKADEKKADEKKADEKKTDDSKATDSAKSDAPAANEEAPSEENATADAEKVKQKPGGCGCSMPGNDHQSRSILGWFGVVTAILLGRRRSRLLPG